MSPHDAPANPGRAAIAPAGRNAPCPCGSGLRYKACHGAVLPAAATGEGSGEAPGEPRHLMHEALRAQQTGHLALAERLYRRVLARIPDEPDCLHMLGVVCHQTGRYREAAALIVRALKATAGRFPVMDRNLRLVAARLMDEPVFWGPDEGPPAHEVFALPAPARDATGTLATAPPPGLRVLVIDWAIPQPDRDSGSMRMLAMLRLWKELGAAVTFTSLAMDCEANLVSRLAEEGIEVLSGPQFWAGLTQVLAAVGKEFDVVLVSRVDVALACTTLLRHFAPQALFVFDTVDLHFLRLQRESRVSGDARTAARAALVRQQELGVVRNADLTLVVSDVEQALLREEVPDARVEILSNVHAAPGRSHGFDRRRDVFFVGAFAHAPNVDAVQWYATEIWPRVRRRLPGVQTFVVGSDMPASVAALAADGIVAVGHAPDLRPWLEGCRVAIAPLRFGAGVKGKVSIALSAGVPVVATTIAAEGMHLEPGREVLLADSAQAFANAVIRLHEDPRTWMAISDAGLLAARRHFSPVLARRVLESVRALASSRRRAPAADDERQGDGARRQRGRVGRRRALLLPPASYGSLGDEAMVRGLAACLRAQDPEWEIDLLSIYGGERWPALPGIRRIVQLPPDDGSGRSRPVGTFEGIVRHYEAFALLGADVLDGHYSSDESFERLALARAASAGGCTTAVLGFSVNDRPDARALAGLADLAARVPLCVRDPVSWRRLQAHAVHNLALVADAAFLMRPAAACPATADIEAWIESEHSSGRRVVMVNVTARLMTELRRGGDERVGALTESVCDLIARRDASILWCAHDLRPTASAGDGDCELAADLSRQVARRLGGDLRQRVAPPLGADETKRLAGRVDMVVSARMHLAIAALGMGTPVVGIGYQGKFEGLWEHFGLRGSLFDAHALDCSRLHEACIDALEHLDDLRAQVAARLPAVLALARKQVDVWLAARPGAADPAECPPRQHITE